MHNSQSPIIPIICPNFKIIFVWWVFYFYNLRRVFTNFIVSHSVYNIAVWFQCWIYFVRVHFFFFSSRLNFFNSSNSIQPPYLRLRHINVRLSSGYLAQNNFRLSKLRLSGLPFTSKTCNVPSLHIMLKSDLYFIGKIVLSLYLNLSCNTYSTCRSYDRISPDSNLGSTNSWRNLSSARLSKTWPLYVLFFFPCSEISTWYLDIFFLVLIFFSLPWWYNM